MTAAGIICEYNPFHNGHALHIEQTRRLTGCDYIVVCMSGAFTQRGDPAIIDKWTRAQMALKNGADLVLELPAAFCVRPADKFAWGGVRTLQAAGCRWLSFGCEKAGLRFVASAAKLTSEETGDFSRAVKDGLAQGYSHARARGIALAAALDVAPAILNMPNTALAIEYAAANTRLASPLELLAVERQGDYLDSRLRRVCSASAIRQAALEGRDYSLGMPPSAYELFSRLFPDGISRESALDAITLHALRNASPEALSLLPDAGEGAYLLLKKHAQTAYSRRDLLEKAKCKRYTMARLNRMATYAALGLKLSRLLAIADPPYLRVLGFRKSALPLLKETSRRCALPLICDPVKLKGFDCFAIERLYTDLWALTVNSPFARAAGQDLTRRMVVEE